MQVTHNPGRERRTYTRVRGVFPAPVSGRLGVLLLHGFTSSLESVSGLVPRLEAAGLAYEMPILSGHGTVPEDMLGLGVVDWYRDVERAFERLATRVDQVVVVGLSMGGLLAIRLALDLPPTLNAKLAGLVLWAPALGLADPLAPLSPLLSLFVPMWKSPDSFHSAERRARNANYPRFATRSLVSLYRAGKETLGDLKFLKKPLEIIHSQRDTVIPFKYSERLFREARSPYCALHALWDSNHDIGMDCECEAVFDKTMAFVEALRA